MTQIRAYKYYAWNSVWEKIMYSKLLIMLIDGEEK
jgi:hypothetical protein